MIKNTFEEQILMGRLPSSPGVGRLLVQLMRRKKPSAAEVARVVRIDPALTGRLIHAARPLASGGGPAVETVESALEVLGPGALLRALRDLSLVSTGSSKWCDGFDYERYWALSLARAVAAEVIVRLSGRKYPEGGYTVGLLADVGRLALASVHPTVYSAVLREAKPGDKASLARLERMRLQIDHSEVSACLFEHWGLRRTFARAAFLLEKDDDTCDTEEAQAIDLAEVLRWAHALAEHHVDGRGGEFPRPAPAPGASGAQDRNELGFSDEVVQKVLAEVGSALAEQRAAVPEAEPEKAEGAEESTTDCARQAEVPARPSKGLRILVVDDDPTSLEILRRTLTLAGHEVKCASDGVEALQIALETNPQAIVADWMMPEMDGVELCKALRCIQIGREMYFLLLTGRDQEEQIVTAYDAGVDEYVTKPFNARILMARLRAGQRVMELREEVEAERQARDQHLRQLSLLNRQLNTAALTDPLTGLSNRRHACDRLAEEWQNSTRTSSPLSVIMIDIDHFKRVNDEFGHEAGDLVLKEVTQILRTNARQGEDVARLGGEEFLVICPNTSISQASHGAERLRAAVAAHVIRAGGFQTSATVSLGVAGRTPGMSGIDSLLKSADAAVYSAKSAGRNQVKLAEELGGRALSA